MALRFVLDPDLTPELRAEIIALWVDVTNAGGAVGFVAPVTAADVRTIADPTLAAIADGPDRLLLGYAGDRLAAMAIFTDNRFHLKTHYRVLTRVMVHPGCQGEGYGLELMRAAERIGRRWDSPRSRSPSGTDWGWTASTGTSATARWGGCRARCGWRRGMTGTSSTCGST